MLEARRESVESAEDPWPSDRRLAQTYTRTSSRPKGEGRGDSVLAALAAGLLQRMR
jgi:hypothetical protein